MYGEEHRKLQKEFDCVKLANRVEEVIVTNEIEDFHGIYRIA